jgi:hypothetical protein
MEFANCVCVFVKPVIEAKILGIVDGLILILAVLRAC